MKSLCLCERERVFDAAHLFNGLSVGPIDRLSWRNERDPSQFGVYWTAPSDGFYWVSDGQSRIAVAVEKRIFRFYRNGVYPRLSYLIRHYLAGLVPAPKVAINFGANIGEMMVALCAMGASVIAIEPDPGVIAALEANAAGRNARVERFAAWNSDGPVTLYLNTEKADSSVINVSGKPVTVEARRIDTIALPGRIGLIVGDAEGAEPEVLDGARETLKRTDYVSVRASAERNGKSTQRECESILRESGFEILHREASGFCTLIGRNRLMQ